MKRRHFVLLLTATTFAAHAGEAPESQWRGNPTTLATLLQDGYRIVSVVGDPHGKAGSVETFYLQRDQSAFKCVEQHPPLEPRSRTPNASFGCFELVQPYTK